MPSTTLPEESGRIITSSIVRLRAGGASTFAFIADAIRHRVRVRRGRAIVVPGSQGFAGPRGRWKEATPQRVHYATVAVLSAHTRMAADGATHDG